MTLQEKLLTVEEFWAQYAGQPYELIHGEVVEVPPAGFEHGIVASRVGFQLRSYVIEHQLGEVTAAETGFQLSPNVMRGPDAAFVSKARLAQIESLEKFAPFAPDLAVEVISPSETASEVQTKVDLYLEAGTALVWTIYLDLRQVVVHYPDGTTRRLKEGDTLDGGDVLPGLAIPVAALFPAKRQG